MMWILILKFSVVEFCLFQFFFSLSKNYAKTSVVWIQSGKSLLFILKWKNREWDNCCCIQIQTYRSLNLECFHFYFFRWEENIVFFKGNAWLFVIYMFLLLFLLWYRLISIGRVKFFFPVQLEFYCIKIIQRWITR